MRNFKRKHADATSHKKGNFLSALSRYFIADDGFSLIEMIVATAIFSVIIASVFGAFSTQMKHSTREYKLAESEMEFGIAKNIIERDLAVAGYGLADDYSNVAAISAAPPRPAAISTTYPTGAAATGYALTLTGTALGIKSRASQGWTYMTAVDGSGVPTFQQWSNAPFNDPREDLRTNSTNPAKNDAVIIMEPSSKKLLVDGSNNWLFRYNGPNAKLTSLSGDEYATSNVGTIAYGLNQMATQPYYSVSYFLDNGASNPSTCAPGTFSLIRAESDTSPTPNTGGDRILACVRDFQVALFLDTNGDGIIDTRDSTGATAAGVDVQTLKKQIKQIVMYALVQTSNRDPAYSYPNASVRVGDAGQGTGHDVTLTSAQMKYRWRLATISVTPRNIR